MACRSNSRGLIVERSSSMAISGLASSYTLILVQPQVHPRTATISAISSTRIRAWHSYSSRVDLTTIWIMLVVMQINMVFRQGVHHSAFSNRVRSTERQSSQTVHIITLRELMMAPAELLNSSKWEGLWAHHRYSPLIFQRKRTQCRIIILSLKVSSTRDLNKYWHKMAGKSFKSL